MRPFRDLLTAGEVVVLLFGCALLACRRESAPPAADKQPLSYYPLAVGNSWTYRCSLEGTFQFDKTVEIASEETRNGIRFWRTKLTMPGKEASPGYYLFASADGVIFKSAEAGQENAEPVVTARMNAGDRLGRFTASRIGKINTPATGDVEALLLENFARDGQAAGAEQRLEWLGRFYVRGIGPIVEADGAGGECVLTAYHVSAH